MRKVCRVLSDTPIAELISVLRNMHLSALVKNAPQYFTLGIQDSDAYLLLSKSRMWKECWGGRSVFGISIREQTSDVWKELLYKNLA